MGLEGTPGIKVIGTNLTDRTHAAWLCTVLAENRVGLQRKLYENHIEGEVTGRLKQTYSIYQKMKVQNIDLDQVFDLTAFRVIVNSIKECYDVLGIIHSFGNPFRNSRLYPASKRICINLFHRCHRSLWEGRDSDPNYKMHQFAEEGIMPLEIQRKAVEEADDSGSLAETTGVAA
jgi:hypothetical protein